MNGQVSYHKANYCNIVNPGTPALMGGTEGVVSGQFMGHKLTMRN